MTDATKVPKWAMEAVDAAMEYIIKAAQQKVLGNTFAECKDASERCRLLAARIIADAAAPSEAEIRRDEMERCCRDICGGCYRREHQFIGASTQSIHHCAAWDIRKRFSNDLHGGQKT